MLAMDGRYCIFFYNFGAPTYVQAINCLKRVSVCLNKRRWIAYEL